MLCYAIIKNKIGREENEWYLIKKWMIFSYIVIKQNEWK